MASPLFFFLTFFRLDIDFLAILVSEEYPASCVRVLLVAFTNVSFLGVAAHGFTVRGYDIVPCFG